MYVCLRARSTDESCSEHVKVYRTWVSEDEGAGVVSFPRAAPEPETAVCAERSTQTPACEHPRTFGVSGQETGEESKVPSRRDPERSDAYEAPTKQSPNVLLKTEFQAGVETLAICCCHGDHHSCSRSFPAART